MEDAPEKGHESDCAGNLDGDQEQTDSSELQDVAEKEARAEQHDARLEPELVRGDSRPEDLWHADGVGNHQTQNDGPENVFDVGKRPVVSLGVGPDILL